MPADPCRAGSTKAGSVEGWILFVGLDPWRECTALVAQLEVHVHHRARRFRCEGMSTYPRTYDLIHADSVFTLYRNREKILLVVKTYWTTHEAMTKISSRTVNTCSDRKFNMWGKEGSINDMKEHCFWSQIMERKGPTVEMAEWCQE
ncbi:putative methyltransferase PMT15 [Zea mays]|uniref:Methyltransferase n=2 Tax=Zea mays TaxID=4577 RepID=A0A1D6K7I6_MAIZE|nr:hypothetical protein ZEAMMB73_Zm00001d029741 [Zea mays]PWZ53572.1 putative methyltransferase PMT15 [Zea mays]